MAFLRPGDLKCVSGAWITTADTTGSGEYICRIQEDAEIFYIDVIALDDDQTFTGGVLTIESQASIGGTQTTLDAITVADNTAVTTVDADDLTEGTVDAGDYISIDTGAAFTAESGFMVNIWYVPR